MNKPKLKQSTLFVLAVLLPSFALILLSWRMIAQERELARNRTRERLEQRGLQFGNALARHLALASDQAEAVADADFSAAHVVLDAGWAGVFARVEGDRLILPWEVDVGRGDRSREEVAFAGPFSAGQRFEFAEGRFALALTSYQSAESGTADPERRAAARLAAARVLGRMGSAEPAGVLLWQVASLPFSTRDEAGMPLAMYAAGQLLNRSDGLDGLVAWWERAVASAGSFAPPALHLLRDYGEEILQRSPGNAPRLDAGLAQLQPVIVTCEAWESLRDELQPKLAELLASAGDNRRHWVYHDHEPGWFVRVTPPGEGRLPTLLAIRAAAMLERASRDPASAWLAGSVPELATRPQAQSAWLGEELSGLQAVFAPGTLAALAVTPQTRLYVLLIVLVTGTTLFGTHLWMRDTRRELQVATLRSGFVASVSHELKTPLTSMQMLTETLRTRELTEAARSEYLDLILAESQRLGRLLKNVLDFSQIEQGTRVYPRRPVGVDDVVAAAARLAEHGMREKNQSLEVRTLDPGLRVHADADALEQALLNLLYNAIKYAARDQRIEVSVSRVGGEVVILVRDFGVGIHPRDHERIFERFVRADEEHNRRIPGTGLGLALVKHIVEGHGGRVSVESAPGRGSTFTIRLPLFEPGLTLS